MRNPDAGSAPMSTTIPTAAGARGPASVVMAVLIPRTAPRCRAGVTSAMRHGPSTKITLQRAKARTVHRIAAVDPRTETTGASASLRQQC
jgi:hypothetical protein